MRYRVLLARPLANPHRRDSSARTNRSGRIRRFSCPVVSPARHGLVFTRDRYDLDIYRFEAGHEPTPVLTSSLADNEQDYSPDGTRIAFASARSGDASEIWLAKADGSHAHQLTHGPGVDGRGRRIGRPTAGGSPSTLSMSPGQWPVWIIDAEGGVPRRLTSDPGVGPGRHGQVMARTSTTGLMTGNRSDIWRIPSAGGMAQQVTRSGSGLAYEVSDRPLPRVST